MATKKISDLTLRSDFDETCILPADDASQTWRVTGAQILAWIISFTRITGQTEDTAPAVDDVLLSGDISASALKKVTKANLAKRSVTAAKTSAYTAAATDEFIPCNASGAGFTVTLPAASGLTGREITIKKTDSSANAVTIDGNASETIDGAATIAIELQYQAVTLVCDGSNWHII